MKSPRAIITISNNHGLARVRLKGWRFQPEIACCSASAERGAKRSDELDTRNHADKHDGNRQVQRHHDVIEIKEFEIRRSTTEIGRAK